MATRKTAQQKPSDEQEPAAQPPEEAAVVAHPMPSLPEDTSGFVTVYHPVADVEQLVPAAKLDEWVEAGWSQSKPDRE